MNFFIGLGLTPDRSILILNTLMDVCLKSTVLLAILFVFLLVFRRISASFRSFLIVTSVLILLLLPFAGKILPGWKMPIVPEVNIDNSANVAITENDVIEHFKSLGVADFLPGNSELSDLLTDTKEINQLSPVINKAKIHWTTWILVVWVAGAAVVLLWMISGKMINIYILGKSEILAEELWTRLLRDISNQMNLKRPVRLLKSRILNMAMTSGFIRPVIIIPETADEWSDERKKVVLTHEIAHVKRWDAFFDLFSKLAIVVYWFNPLIWLANNRIRIDRERACDDHVLNSGTKPSDYVTELMDIYSGVAVRARPIWLAATLSQGSNLKDRLLRILEPDVNRRTARGLVLVFACLVIALMAIPISSFDIWTAPSSAKTKEIAFTLKDPTDIPALLEELTISDQQKKEKIIEILSGADRKLFDDIIIGSLNWLDDETRRLLIDFMNRRDARLVDSILQKHLEGEDVEMRDRCEKALRQIKGFKSVPGLINSIGYGVLKAGDVNRAIEVFKINAESFPEYSNGYDSLAEAYMKNNNTRLAELYYKKSLQLNPYNSNAVKQLKLIEEIRTGKRTGDD